MIKNVAVTVLFEIFRMYLLVVDEARAPPATVVFTTGAQPVTKLAHYDVLSPLVFLGPLVRYQHDASRGRANEQRSRDASEGAFF